MNRPQSTARRRLRAALRRLHVHATRSTERIGTFVERTCRCGQLCLELRCGRTVTWSSPWGTRDQVTAAVRQHFAEAIVSDAR